MTEARVLNPLVEQFQNGGVPHDLRLIAAQGALPLKPTDLVELLYFLLTDPDKEIHQTADQTLRQMPVAELLPLVKDKTTPTGVLVWMLTHREETELREVALQNVSVPDEAIEALVAGLPSELAELVVINQVRLLRRTSLLVALESNAQLNNDQRRRLRELRESFHIGETPAAEPVAPAAPSPPPSEAAAPVAEAPPPAEEPALTEQEAIVHYLTEEEREETEKVSALQKVFRLNTAQKVVTALKGTREERAILIRDSNRLVATAVLGSPRLTETEIEAFASMKNLSDEILRKIGSNKEWTKRYGVVNSLVRNPRTPVAISLGMVSRLNPRDMKNVAVDRNVPEVIRQQAQRFVRSAIEKRG